MGWTTSIHIRTRDIENVIASLRSLNHRECFVGVSGENWVGVWSQEAEQSASQQTPQLALQLSGCVKDYVLGLTDSEDGFAYWLFRTGKLLDKYPASRLKCLTGLRRPIVDLCMDVKAQQRVEAIFKARRRLRPAEALGMTEDEFIAQAYRDMEKMQTMSREELKHASAEYARLRNPTAAGADILCNALGIVNWNWIYSDFEGDNLDQENLNHVQKI